MLAHKQCSACPSARPCTTVPKQVVVIVPGHVGWIMDTLVAAARKVFDVVECVPFPEIGEIQPQCEGLTIVWGGEPRYTETTLKALRELNGPDANAVARVLLVDPRLTVFFPDEDHPGMVIQGEERCHVLRGGYLLSNDDFHAQYDFSSSGGPDRYRISLQPLPPGERYGRMYLDPSSPDALLRYLVIVFSHLKTTIEEGYDCGSGRHEESWPMRPVMTD